VTGERHQMRASLCGASLPLANERATFEESAGRYERATAPERALYDERTAQFERALFLK
jgi:hypothetical protein